MHKMKTVKPGKADVVHVETPLGIVNIHVGLHDVDGRRVENVSVQCNDYAGEPTVRIDGNLKYKHKGMRLVELSTSDKLALDKQLSAAGVSNKFQEELGYDKCDNGNMLSLAILFIDRQGLAPEFAQYLKRQQAEHSAEWGWDEPVQPEEQTAAPQ
jgi:hypothetical protein